VKGCTKKQAGTDPAQQIKVLYPFKAPLLDGWPVSRFLDNASVEEAGPTPRDRNCPCQRLREGEGGRGQPIDSRDGPRTIGLAC
jgi:hypothetical protein